MSADDFDLDRAIGLAEAQKRIRGRGGRRPHMKTLRRWADPKRGCYPAGKGGPVIFLRTRKVSGDVLTMPGWVAAFEAERARLGVRT